MSKKIIGIFVFIFTAMIASPFEARAQYGGTSPFIRYSSNIFVNSNMHLFFQKRWQIAHLRAAGKHEVADALEGRRTNPGQASGQSAPTAENILRRVPLSQTSFKPAGKFIMPDELTGNLAGASADETATAQMLFTELLKSYDEMLVRNKEDRLRNNVAGAAAFALLVSRFILTGEELTHKQSEALLQDINALLVSSDKFRILSARDRQAMYETFAIIGGLALTYHEQEAKEGDSQKIGEGAELAKFIFSQFFGMPVDQVRFTDDGVRF